MNNSGVGPVPEVVDTTNFCSTFPEVFGAEVWRDNVLHLIDKTFEGDTQLLIVEGLIVLIASLVVVLRFRVDSAWVIAASGMVGWLVS
jgi:hypothetical protein